MVDLQNNLRDTQLSGPDSRFQQVHVLECPLLAEFGMMTVGIVHAEDGYCLIRRDPDFGSVRVTFAGAGRVFVDGKWVMSIPGTAYISPAHQFHAFHTLRGQKWGLLWVAYRKARQPREVVNVDAPKLINADPRALHAAISGLYSEVSGPRQTQLIALWLELIHRNVLRINLQMGKIDRLWQLWAEVDARLTYPWTRQKLSDLAGMSGEYLRRICQEQYGHSPMRHLTTLRMQRASALLMTTPQKIEAIAMQVGYTDGFAFATAFKRWAGIAPGAYRNQSSPILGETPPQRNGG